MIGAATPSPADTAEAAPSIDSAIAALQTRVRTAPTLDGVAPNDSVVVRVGSDMRETVLFVNGQQVGIVGGRGLLSATLPPGEVTVSVRRLNCRDWDSTFTLAAGRRITFVERSPRC